MEGTRVSHTKAPLTSVGGGGGEGAVCHVWVAEDVAVSLHRQRAAWATGGSGGGRGLSLALHSAELAVAFLTPLGRMQGGLVALGTKGCDAL